MSLRRVVLSLAFLAAPVIGAVAFPSDAAAQAKKKGGDPLADAYQGKIMFLSVAPPATIGDKSWFPSHQITSKDENSDKKWPLHVMIFLAKPLDVNKLDLMVYKIDKKGNKDFVQKLEQFPNTESRSIYLLITLRNAAPYEPSTPGKTIKYQIKAVASTGAVAESPEIELTGKEEKVSGGPIDFTAGMDLSKPKEEKATAPFDAAAATEALKKVIYEDCKTSASKGGDAKIQIKFAGKDGKVLDAVFPKDPPVPYSDATQTCIQRRFEKAKTKPFTGEESHTVAYKVSL